jgi:hypothetical protein
MLDGRVKTLKEGSDSMSNLDMHAGCFCRCGSWPVRPKPHHLFRRDPVFHPQNSDLTDVNPMPAMNKKEQSMQRARRQLPERALQPTVRVTE